MSIPTKANELPQLDEPSYFITGRADGRYGQVKFDEVPGVGDARVAAEEAQAAEAAAAISAAQAALYGPLTFPAMGDLLASSALDASKIGNRAGTQAGQAVDLVATGTGDFNHPQTGIGLKVVRIRRLRPIDFRVAQGCAWAACVI